MGKFDECIFVDVPSVDGELCTRLNRRALSTRMILSPTRDRFSTGHVFFRLYLLYVHTPGRHSPLVSRVAPSRFFSPLSLSSPIENMINARAGDEREREREIPRVYFLTPKFIHLRIFNAFIQQISTSISVFLLARSTFFRLCPHIFSSACIIIPVRRLKIWSSPCRLFWSILRICIHAKQPSILYIMRSTRKQWSNLLRTFSKQTATKKKTKRVWTNLF